MKVVVTSSGTSLDAPVDQRFGRARFFLLIDSETQDCEAHDNTQNLNAAQGAGIQAAEDVVRLGAEAVISGHFGPKAFRVLKTAGIRMYATRAATAAEAVVELRADKLVEAGDADVEGHW